MIRPIASDRRWTFAESPEDLWVRIGEVEHFRSWWPWLRRFDPGAGLVHAASWHCEVAPPLPYLVRFTIDFDRVEEGRNAETTVTGDVEGTATLMLDELDGGGTSARLVSHLAPASPLLRAVGRFARPMVQWGHDWVLDQGRRQFVERGLR